MSLEDKSNPAAIATIAPGSQSGSGMAQREIELWTTKDGREIPLDEMSDHHIANAIRVLSAWRNGLKKKDGDDPVIADLTGAIDRFKRLERDRRRLAKKAAGPSDGNRWRR